MNGSSYPDDGQTTLYPEQGRGSAKRSSGHQSGLGELDELKSVLRDAVQRVEDTMDKLRANWEEYEVRRQELDQQAQLVAEQMEEVSKMREQLEAQKSKQPGGLFGACYRPPVATAPPLTPEES
mmetsp:Transcript_92596/g.276141  ORF Transcript_92596/g.276141 Transcript_92596/m.276141 type:complete len:124 (+) Transcript_92596:85-456(+)